MASEKERMIFQISYSVVICYCVQNIKFRVVKYAGAIVFCRLQNVNL